MRKSWPQEPPNCLTNALPECKMRLNGYLTPFFQPRGGWCMDETFCEVPVAYRAASDRNRTFCEEGPIWLDQNGGTGAGRVLAGPSFFRR
jgi:hypothetical protein